MAEAEEFSGWLSTKLQNINPDVDLDIFVPYLIGILETEDTESDETKDSIQGFLAEIVVKIFSACGFENRTKGRDLCVCERERDRQTDRQTETVCVCESVCVRLCVCV